MALFISHDETRLLLTMPEAIDVAEEALIAQSVGEATAPSRQRMAVPGGVHRSMSGDLPSRAVFGTKAGLQHFPFADGVVKAPVFALFSSETGDLLALFWSDLATQIRTGAMGGVSVRHLARQDAARVGVIGSGRQARAQLQAIVAERPQVSVAVYSRDSAHREGFASRMAVELGVRVDPVTTARTAVTGADIVIAATNAREPVFDGTHLEPGTHVISIRSSYSHDISLGGARREIDDTTVARSAIVCVDSLDQARAQESPEIMPAIERATELGSIAAGTEEGRMDPAQITLFKSFGTGVVDVAVAALVYRKAVDAGLGTKLSPPHDDG